MNWCFRWFGVYLCDFVCVLDLLVLGALLRCRFACTLWFGVLIWLDCCYAFGFGLLWCLRGFFGCYSWVWVFMVC